MKEEHVHAMHHAFATGVGGSSISSQLHVKRTLFVLPFDTSEL